MLHDQLINLIRQGEIQEALTLLVEFNDKHYSRSASDVTLISARFNQVTREHRKGTLPQSDFRLEMNSITQSLLGVIGSMEGLQEENFKKKKSREEILMAISDLGKRFVLCRRKSNAIQSNQTRLREKNEIARELGEIFIQHPDLIPSFYKTNDEGIITGIANKYKRLPEANGIDFFESITAKELGNFTKCSIVNALAEIIYSGQLRMGDDKRIALILDGLFPNSYQTVKLSITRVSVELEYFLGNMLQPV